MTWDENHDKVYSVNASSVTIIDGDSDEVISSVTLPHDIQMFLKPVTINHTNGKVYVGNYASSSLSVIDVVGDSLIASLNLPEQNPYALEYNPDQNKIYVACQSGPAIVVIDGEDDQVTNTISLPSGPYSLLHNPYNGKLYCACVKVWDWIEQLAVVDCHSEQIDSVISIESSPVHYGAGTLPRYSLVLNPFEEALYMANYYDSKISIIDFSLTGIDDPVRPESFTNLKVLPNPFHERTSIQYTIAKAHDVRIDLYDCMGRYLTCLVARFHSPGTYAVNWRAKTHNGEQLPSGVYFCRIEVGDLARTKKMILLR